LETYEKKYNKLKWTLLEYVSPNKRRAIHDWREGMATPARKASFDVFIKNMAKTSHWKSPEIKALKGKKWKGLYELRWRSADGVPHRIGGYFSADNEFVMLVGWTHNAKKYDPPSALETLIERRNKVKTGEAHLSEFEIPAS